MRAGAATLEVIDGLRCCVCGAAAPELVVVLYHGGAHGVEFAALAALLCERLLPRRLPGRPAAVSKWRELVRARRDEVPVRRNNGRGGEGARVVRATPGGVPEMRTRQRRFLDARKQGGRRTITDRLASRASRDCRRVKWSSGVGSRRWRERSGAVRIWTRAASSSTVAVDVALDLLHGRTAPCRRASSRSSGAL